MDDTSTWSLDPENIADADVDGGEVGQEEQRDSNSVVRHVNKLERVTVRLPLETRNELRYWSMQKGMSMSEYVAYALNNQFGRDNGHIDNETLLTARMNQFNDLITNLSTQVANNTSATSDLTRLFTNLISGDTELTDDDDGEL